MDNKWTKKKKIWVAVATVLIAALIATVCYIAFRPDKPVSALITKAKIGDITETFETTATIESGKQTTFEITDGIKVEKVLVRVGDSVKAGDVLATFDTSSLNATLEEKRVSYTAAQNAYTKYLDTSYSASKDLKAIDGQISALEKEVAALEKKVEAEKKENTNPPKTETPVVSNSGKVVEELRDSLKDLFGNTKLGDKIADRLLSSDSSSAQMITALQNMLNASSSFDMSAMSSLTSSMISENEKNLISKEFELVQLKVRQGTLSAQSGDGLKSVYKSIADTAKSSYESLAEQIDSFKKGWIAEADGFIREINIVEGQVFSSKKDNSPLSGMDMTSILGLVSSGSFDLSNILSSLTGSSQIGMIVECYPLNATFELGKYDISKIQLDSKVKVKSTSGDEFKGTVTYISPVATASSGININTIMGSSTSSASTVTTKVSIDNPDRTLIIGMDVEISVDLQTKKNVLLVPVESIQYDDSGYFVFKYDKDSKTIKKTTVEVGLFDSVNYEVLSGLENGDSLIKAPTTTMTDDQRVTPAEK